MKFIKRFLTLRKVNTENGMILFSKCTEISIAPGASINIINGTFKIGYPIDEKDSYILRLPKLLTEQQRPYREGLEDIKTL